MGSAADVWICGRCRSLNSLGRSRCYKCSTPKEIAATRPEDLSTHVVPHVDTPTGTFRSTENLAVGVGIATFLFIAAGLVARFTFADAVNMIISGNGEDAQALLRDRLALLLLAPITAVLGLIVYGLWIRRVVLNLPTLGAGYSKVGPGFAFVEPLIPVFNIYSIPARLAEVITKLGGSFRAMSLLGLALVLAIGPSGVYLLVWRFERIFGSATERFQILSLGSLLVFVCYASALLIGNVVIWQVEAMQRTKLKSLRTPGDAGASA